MKVTIDTDLCTACDLCCTALPEVFEMGDETARVIAPDPLPGELEDEVRDAAADCPEEAIVIA